jgi:hypothetical protein
MYGFFFKFFLYSTKANVEHLYIIVVIHFKSCIFNRFFFLQTLRNCGCYQ